MRNFLCCLLVAILATGGAPSVVMAQQPADGAEIARKVEALSSQGAQKYRNQDFAGAVELFLQAYELEPVPNLLYNIAKCYERMDDWDNAIAFYERFVVAPDVESEARQHALEQVQTLRARVQQERGGEPGDDSAPVTPPDGDAVATPTPAAAPNRTAAYITLGAGAVLLAGGGTFGWLASMSEQDFRNATTPDARLEARDSGKTQALVADGLFVAGALTMLVGTYLFITASPTASPATTAGAASVSPWISKTGAGVGVSWGF